MDNTQERRQAIFDAAVSGLIAQGEPAIDEHGGCVYRGRGGLKCAVGMLIPDNAYDEFRMEGHLVGSLIDMSELKGLFKSEDLLFLEDLQATHDDCVTDALLPTGVSQVDNVVWLSKFRFRAISLANVYGLSSDVLK